MIAEMVFARVVELVDTQVSEACIERYASSSLASGTNNLGAGEESCSTPLFYTLACFSG
jgi:hypothetical protein